MKLLFMLVGTWISKLVVFGNQKTHTGSYKSQCAHYGIWSEDIIGPYSIENEENVTITVNRGRQLSYYDNWFYVPALYGIDVNDVTHLI